MGESVLGRSRSECVLLTTGGEACLLTTLLDAVNIISAPRHEKKLAETCLWSWLHCWESARYLHAGVLQGQIVLSNSTFDVITPFVEKSCLSTIHAYLQTLDPSVETPKPSLWTELPLCESKEEMDAASRGGRIHFTGEMRIVESKVVFRMNPAYVAADSRFSLLPHVW